MNQVYKYKFVKHNPGLYKAKKQVFIKFKNKQL